MVTAVKCFWNRCFSHFWANFSVLFEI